MKRIAYIAVALIISMLQSCAPDSESPKPSFDLSLLHNEWQLDKWQGEEPEFDLYMEFKSDKTFAIYQQIESVRFVKYSGKYSIDGSKITGKYSDGQSWGSSYTLSFDKQSGDMTMTSENEESVYVKCSIPSSVIEGAEPYIASKCFGGYWL